MNDAWLLTGKRALITGATKGIGRAVADEFVELGAEVMVVARSEEDVAAQLAAYEAQGGTAHGVVGDMTTEADRAKVAERARSTWGALDVLVNNVGSNVRKPTLEYTVDDLRRVMALNVESAFELSRLCHPLLKTASQEAGDASIINVSSTTSRTVVGITTAAYSMSKAAMEQMSNFLAVEWGADGIRVNSVHPWFIETPLTESILGNETLRKKIVDPTPLGRVGQPEEVGRAVAFLAMAAASYISGANLDIDGGFAKVGVH